jgi:hypothetical protein
MRVRFVVHLIRGPRLRHVVNEDEVRVVLGRLPGEVTAPLKEVHFNDRFREHFKLVGTPMRIEMKLSRNPFAEGEH